MIKCRVGCGACCIAPSISSSIPEMPQGKPAGLRCLQLTEENKCKIFGASSRPAVCEGLKPSREMCGETNEEAYNYLTALEEETLPQKNDEGLCKMTKTNYHIKPFNPQLAKATEEVIKKNLKEVNCKDYPEVVIEAMINYYTIDNLIKISEKRDVFVIEKDGIVMGTASLEGNSIHTVFIDPEYHGTGLGKILMEYIEKIARGRGLQITTLDASLTAYPFYKKLGYIDVRNIESEEFGKAIVMEKKLN